MPAKLTLNDINYDDFVRARTEEFLDDLGVQENVKLEVEKTHYILFKPEILHLVKKSHKLRQRASILTHAGVLLVGGKPCFKKLVCEIVCLPKIYKVYPACVTYFILNHLS